VIFAPLLGNIIDITYAYIFIFIYYKTWPVVWKDTINFYTVHIVIYNIHISSNFNSSVGLVPVKKENFAFSTLDVTGKLSTAQGRQSLILYKKHSKFVLLQRDKKILRVNPLLQKESKVTNYRFWL
jgi:hypothetical protein